MADRTQTCEYTDNPCALPNCPCIIHELGVPRADVVIEAMRKPSKDGKWVAAEIKTTFPYQPKLRLISRSSPQTRLGDPDSHME
jgi:hypothetical protein